MELKNLFKKSTPPASVVYQTNAELVEEIHGTFYAEVDRLRAKAGIFKDLSSTQKVDSNKNNRLELLGFTNTKDSGAKFDKLAGLSKDFTDSKDVREAVAYYYRHYPLQKFITEEGVKSICAKYNLVYSTVDRYEGFVPEKNLKEIENFKIRYEDLAYEKISRRSGSVEFINYRDMDKIPKDFFNISRAKLEIAAPLKDFNQQQLNLKKFKLSEREVEDPVVLQPVVFKGVKHYLILTAWGDEASDELVLNHINN